MIGFPITFEQMQSAIQELHLALPKFGLSADSLPRLTRLYREALEDFDVEAVSGAARMLLKTEDRFPSPAKWLETCRAWSKHSRGERAWVGETDPNGHDIVCKVCRAVPRWAWLRMTVTPFSAPVAPDAVMYADGATMRRIAPCHPERHHGGPCVPVPENFIEWVTVGA